MADTIWGACDDGIRGLGADVALRTGLELVVAEDETSARFVDEILHKPGLLETTVRFKPVIRQWRAMTG